MRLNMTHQAPRLAAVLCLLCGLALDVRADVPRTIPFQGVLKTSTGALVPDGPQAVTFRLYDALAAPIGGALWTSSGVSVSVTKGLFNTTLGDGSGAWTGLAFDKQYYVGVQVGANPEMLPRYPMAAVPYALNATRMQLPFAGSTAMSGSAFTVENTGTGAAIVGASTLGTAARFDGRTFINGSIGIGRATPVGAMDVAGSAYFAAAEQLDARQPVVEGYGNLPTGGTFWQSFTTRLAGTLTRVDTPIAGQGGLPWTGDLRIYEGVGTGGTLL